VDIFPSGIDPSVVMLGAKPKREISSDAEPPGLFAEILVWDFADSQPVAKFIFHLVVSKALARTIRERTPDGNFPGVRDV